MVKIDIINISLLDSEIKNKDITKSIMESESECILFINKRDKIKKSFLERLYYISRENNFEKIVSPQSISKLSLRGKLIPTDNLKNFFKQNESIFDTYLYEFLYTTPDITCNDITFTNNCLPYIECKSDLFNSINKLDSLELYLKSKNLYDNESFKKLYIKEIIFRYLQFRKNQSLLYKGFSEDYLTLVIIYILMLVKFDDSKDFVKELLSEKHDFLINYDIEKVIHEGFEKISKANKEQLISKIKLLTINTLSKK